MKPSRRSVLVGGALGLAAACTSRRAPVAPPSQDELRRRDAAIREEALLSLYDAALAAFPALAPLLAPLRGDHEEHLRSLGGDDAVRATAAPALVGRSAAETRARLRALEQSTARQHAAAAVPASRHLAPLLASLSACEASHAAVL